MVIRLRTLVVLLAVVADAVACGVEETAPRVDGEDTRTPGSGGALHLGGLFELSACEPVARTAHCRAARSVGGGENRGKTLKHDVVVRWLEVVGRLDGDRSGGAYSTTVRVANEWNPADLRVVAFVQERTGRSWVRERGV